ncbi:hypothetical protein SISNIDRAFT_493890 [Sistotremastrum niveocremeum HHB9708]|uniref:Protein kinase domain-containing protein n=1 Tax=Sistotremastrum niveocremeum HHB9708 TaxID=1314777 RepID=A0A164XVN2_9AGAM|nr:hypothetical protein SISNIDRAFT_493890 [Sistotremastrum niveocremeum HHB9708]
MHESFNTPKRPNPLDPKAQSFGDTPRSAPTTGGVASVAERNHSIEPVLKTELADGISVDAPRFLEKILQINRFPVTKINRCLAALVDAKLFDSRKSRFLMPKFGKETAMYPPLIKILNAIAKAAKEVGIENVNQDIWHAVSGGIEGKDPNHQSIFPDIASTFKSGQEDEDIVALSWQRLAIICELKVRRDQDNKEDLHLQLAKYARKILMYQRGRRRFVLGWTLCGDIVRAWLFDRAGALASESFNYNTNPARFIRMIVAFSSLSSERLGYDPTITEVNGKLILDFTYYDKTGQRVTEKFVITDSIVPRPSLRGRGTVVWRAYKLSDEDKPPEQRQIYAIKDSWRDLNRDFDEGHFFEKIPDLGYRDGIVEVVEFAAVEIGDGQQDTIAKTVRQGIQGHRKSSFDHRGHVRLLMKGFGVSLDNFSSLRELIGVIMDAIKGHQKLVGRKILHRDVSFGNILMTESIDLELGRRRGYLIDLDFAKDLEAREAVDALADVNAEARNTPPILEGDKPEKARITGTLPFIAIDVLLELEYHREVHDLESFFWVIVWICLKYQGPDANLVDLTHGPRNRERNENLKLLLRCQTLREGGKQKRGVLGECRGGGMKRFSHVYLWRLERCIAALSKIITDGINSDQERRHDETPSPDKRSYEEFLLVLQQTYDSLPERDPEDLIGKRAPRSILDEPLHSPAQRSVGSFTSRHGSSLSRTEEEPQPTIPVRRQPVRKATQKAAATKPDNKTKAESSKPAWR